MGPHLPMPGLALARALCLVAAVAVGLAVWTGLATALAQESLAVRILVPLAASVTLTTLLAGSWHILLGAAATARGGRLAVVLGLGAALVALAIATSSWWLATALGGGAALRHHRAAAVAVLEATGRAVLDAATPELQLLRQVEAAAEGYGALAAREAEGGVRTGRKGRGPVARELEDVAAAFAAQAAAMRELAGQREARLAAMAAALRRAVAAEEETAFVTALAEAHALVAEAERMRATDLAMAGSVQLPGLSATPELGRLAEAVTATAARIARERPPVAMPGYVPLTRSEAVLVHADAVPAAWMVAVALDALPLLLLAILVVARRGEESGAQVTALRPTGS